MQPYSSKALHFLALSVKVHIEKLEAALAATDDEVIAWFRESLQQIKDAGLLHGYLAALPDD